MDTVSLVARNGDLVRQALELGELLHIETASEEITDEFLLFAIDSGLLKTWADAFPDPRQQPEISPYILLAASLAARFAKLYALRHTGFVLRSARVLGALGYSVEVTNAGQGISRKGTQEDTLISPDVWRKLLVKMEQGISPETPLEPAAQALYDALEGKSAVPDPAARPSRRAAKQTVDEADARRRGLGAAQRILDWYNQTVGPSLVAYAQLGEGRRIHLLDVTKVVAPLERATYECGTLVKNDDQTYSRGYKLATVRTLLDTAGLLSQVCFGPIHVHDLALSRELVRAAPVLRSGDLLIEDRGFLEGGLLTELKRERGVDVMAPLRSNMHAYLEAVALAEYEGKWRAHPTRQGQEIAFVEGVEHVWDECEVPLNACVIRYYDEKKKGYGYLVVVTSDLSLSAEWIVRHYQERPEIEQDYQQLKGEGWKLQKLTTTRYSEIVMYVVSVALAYSLYQLFANTQAGARFAGKTRQAIALEQLKSKRTHIIVYARGYFEIYETLRFMQIVIGLPPDIQGKLGKWLGEHLSSVKKRE